MTCWEDWDKAGGQEHEPSVAPGDAVVGGRMQAGLEEVSHSGRDLEQGHNVWVERGSESSGEDLPGSVGGDQYGGHRNTRDRKLSVYKYYLLFQFPLNI